MRNGIAYEADARLDKGVLLYLLCLSCGSKVHRYLRLVHLLGSHPVIAVTATAERADIGVLFSLLN